MRREREELAEAQAAFLRALLDPAAPVPQGFDERRLRIAGAALRRKRARHGERHGAPQEAGAYDPWA